MKLSKARKEWHLLNDFDRKGHLAIFRYGRKDDNITNEEAIKMYRKLNSHINLKDLIILLLSIILFIAFL